MTRFRRAVLAAATFFAVAATAGRAPAADAPAGFHSTGSIVIATAISGTPLNVGGQIALYARGSRYRLDVLSLAFPGTDPTAGALASALLAPGGATLIYDGATGAISAYSVGNHVFYADTPALPPAGTARSAPAVPATGLAGPLATLAAVARQLHDMQQASIQLIGHSVTNGHPTDDLDIMLRRQRPGKPLEDYHAQISLADDLDGLPVRIALSSTPATPQSIGGSLRLDLTAVSRETPGDEIFAVPAGLTRVPALGDVLSPKR